jgi:hypothetical protein
MWDFFLPALFRWTKLTHCSPKATRKIQPKLSHGLRNANQCGVCIFFCEPCNCVVDCVTHNRIYVSQTKRQQNLVPWGEGEIQLIKGPRKQIETNKMVDVCEIDDLPRESAMYISISIRCVYPHRTFLTKPSLLAPCIIWALFLGLETYVAYVSQSAKGTCLHS